MLIITIIAGFLAGIFFAAAKDVDDNNTGRPGVDAFFQTLFLTLAIVMSVCTFVGICLTFG